MSLRSNIRPPNCLHPYLCGKVEGPEGKPKHTAGDDGEDGERQQPVPPAVVLHVLHDLHRHPKFDKLPHHLHPDSGAFQPPTPPTVHRYPISLDGSDRFFCSSSLLSWKNVRWTRARQPDGMWVL